MQVVMSCALNVEIEYKWEDSKGFDFQWEGWSSMCLTPLVYLACSSDKGFEVVP